MAKIKVKAVQDNEGHWYVIPNKLEADFDEALESRQIEDGAFEEYRTNGDLNNIQLYAEEEDLDNL